MPRAKNSRHQESEYEYVLGVDISTTACKAIVWDRRGQEILSKRHQFPLYSPQANYFEQDPLDWWSSVTKVLKEITKSFTPKCIRGLAISNQRETFVTIDHHGNSLRPAIIWLDERCKSMVEPFARKIGKQNLHQITGKPVDYAPVVYRLAWMKAHEPDLFAKIYKVLDVHGYIVWKLTNSFKTSFASADPFGLYDLQMREWSPIIVRALGLETNHFATTYPPGSILGTLTEEAAQATGLSTQTLVIAGGGDGQAAGLGVNALNSQQAYLNLGTAVVAGIFGSTYIANKYFRTLMSCADSGFYYECSLRAGTFLIDWMIKNIFNCDPLNTPTIYKQLETKAQAIPVGSDQLIHLPYLCGVMNPYWDSNARSAFIGLSPAHTQAHMYRSVLEGIAFEQKLVLNQVEKVTNSTINNLLVIGGGVKNELWCKIISDITNKTIVYPHTSEASCLGAGIAAAKGVNWYTNITQAAQSMTAVKGSIKPNSLNHQQYRKIFAQYKKVYPLLRKLK